MRIVHVHSDCTRSRGIPRAAVAVAEGCARRGHEVHYLHAYRSDITSTEISLHRLRVFTRPHFIEFLHFANASSKACVRLSPDIIHTHGEVPFGDVVTAQSCHARALAVRSALEPDRSMRNRGIVDALRLRNERKLFRDGPCKQIIAVSPGVQREIREEYGVPAERISVIPNGVDLDAFDPRSKVNDRLEVRNKLEIPSDAFVLLLVANEFRRKGVHIIVDALGRLRRRNLWLIVSGEDDPTLFRNQAGRLGLGSRVRFLPSQRAVERLYFAADLFVMPSYYEAFSLATVEAAAAGLPLLVTRVNGTEELVVDGVNGAFVQRDADDVAAKIGDLLDDSERLSAMGENSRKRAEAYAWPLIVDRVLSVYRRLTGKGT